MVSPGGKSRLGETGKPSASRNSEERETYHDVHGAGVGQLVLDADARDVGDRVEGQRRRGRRRDGRRDRDRGRDLLQLDRHRRGRRRRAVDHRGHRRRRSLNEEQPSRPGGGQPRNGVRRVLRLEDVRLRPAGSDGDDVGGAVGGRGGQAEGLVVEDALQDRVEGDLVLGNHG